MAGAYHLTGSRAIERGACYSYSMDLASSTGEYSLAGYTVTGYLRRKWDGQIGPYWTPTITSEASGIVNLELSASETAELSRDFYQQEIFIYPSGGCPIRVLYGDVDVEGGGFE